MKNTKGKIITVTSSKGGVGKTILLLNLAGIYQTLNKKVLILDFDFSSGGIALNLNLEPSKTIYQVIDDLNNNRYLNYKDYITSYSEMIDVVVAPKDPRQASRIDVKVLNTFIEEVSHHYDAVLIDTTHGLNRNNILTLDLSDKILYVLSNDFMDLKNTKNFMAIMKSGEVNNIKVVLNESRDPDLDYFNKFDIKSIIKTNIDYTVSKSFHISEITRYILEGKIFTLNKNLTFRDKKDMKKFIHMAEDLLLED